MIGGNETGHGGIFSPGGNIYKESFVGALRTIRQGSPKSACLVMSPLDQGEQNDDGNVSSKKSVSRMVQLQKEVALEEGCAFWNSWKFMGGEGSFVRWLNQGLAWTDLAHFTAPGLQRIGNGFADALLNSYRKFEEGN
jgi:lysophospholipase L1-like esterase